MSKTLDESLVLAKNFPTRALAEAGQSFLKRNHIESILQGSDVAGTGMPQGFDILVAAKHVGKAREMLERLYDGI